MSSPLSLVRPDLRAFVPYEAASYGPGLTRLHANEAPWRHDWDNSAAGLNRYPDPQPAELLGRLAALYGVEPERVLLTRGSDDGIDVLTRALCRAGRDRVVVCPPTFGMYAVSARIQGAGVDETPLLAEQGFAVDAEAVIETAGQGARLVFLCSPNNPTGNATSPDTVARICAALREQAVVVVDEAYGEFAGGSGAAGLLAAHPNLVVLRTLSKAYALAGARLGILMGQPDLLALLRSLLPPYPIPTPSLAAVEQLCDPASLARARAEIEATVARREDLARALRELPVVERVWPSDANFLLVRCRDAARVLEAARAEGLLLRDFSDRPGLAACVRVTVGDDERVARVLAAFAAAGRCGGGQAA